MPTHKEKDELIKQLKDKLREYTSLAKEKDAQKEAALGNLPELALGLVQAENGDFKLIRVNYCSESGEAKVASVDNAVKVGNTKSRELSQMNMVKALHEEIFGKL